jgi:hypothetical protein
MVVDDLSIKNINHAHQETKTVFSNYINVFDMYFPELIRSGGDNTWTGRRLGFLKPRF